MLFVIAVVNASCHNWKDVVCAMDYLSPKENIGCDVL